MADSEDDAAESVETEGGEAGGPEAGHSRRAPEGAGEHEDGERAEGVEANAFADAALGESKDGVRQAAQRAEPAGQPAKAANG